MLQKTQEVLEFIANDELFENNDMGTSNNQLSRTLF